jgi:translation elongation factor EF-Tu-like GTPase
MGSFRVEDAFHIAGRGWVVSGRGVDGEIVTGDIVHTVDEAERQYEIRGIERFVIDIGKPVRESKDEIPPGTVLAHYDYVL